MSTVPQFLVSPESKSAESVNGLAEFLYALYASLLKAGMPDRLAQIITTQTAHTFISESIKAGLQPNKEKE